MADRGQDIASVIKKQIEGFGKDLGMARVRWIQRDPERLKLLLRTLL